MLRPYSDHRVHRCYGIGDACDAGRSICTPLALPDRHFGKCFAPTVIIVCIVSSCHPFLVNRCETLPSSSTTTRLARSPRLAVASMCQHLARESNAGFFHAGDDIRPDAWCAECDQVLMEHRGEWNDTSEAFAGITLLCSHCYDIVRDCNEVLFRRIKPKQRPSLEDDSWELGSAQRLHRLYPETFEIPALHELAALQLGDMVKLIFLFVINDEQNERVIQGERMWVTIEHIDGSDYVGQLESEPVLTDLVRPLDKIVFRQEHIATIFIRKDDPSATNEFDADTPNTLKRVVINVF